MASIQRPLREMALFAGAGGGILGGKLLGWETICAVEINTFCSRRLMQRQNEGHLSPFPVWDDVCTFDGRPWRGLVDVVSGGFPCQGISIAGKGGGIDGDARSGLWREQARIIGDVQPRFALVENSPRLTVLGLGAVLGDLAAMGYNAKWGVLSSYAAGGDIDGERIWIVAEAMRFGVSGLVPSFDIDEAGQRRTDCKKGVQSRFAGRILDPFGDCGMPPMLCRGADEVADRVDRVRAIGNGQDASLARLAWRVLTAS